MKDFFISYTEKDRSWAEWIGWQLEEAGCSIVLQAWDFRPGENFVQGMQEAASETSRTIAVLSPDYFCSVYTQSEWQAAFNKDPTGQRSLLLPVRVREVELKGLLNQISYIDFVGLDEMGAQKALLEGILGKRAKPTIAPTYPAQAVTSGEKAVTYPGEQPGVQESEPTSEPLRSKCRPLSVTLAITHSESTNRIFLGLEKCCNPDDTAFFQFRFILSQRL